MNRKHVSIITVISLFIFLAGCSNKQVYDYMASRQCFENEEVMQDGNIAPCHAENEVNGMTYEEYERERQRNKDVDSDQ